MNRKDIIRMAREACVQAPREDWNSTAWVFGEETLERFAALVAALVAAAEREACAMVADSISEDQWALYKGRPPYTGKELERASDYTQGKSDGAEVCAAAIRARGDAK